MSTQDRAHPRPCTHSTSQPLRMETCPIEQLGKFRAQICGERTGEGAHDKIGARRKG